MKLSSLTSWSVIVLMLFITTFGLSSFVYVVFAILMLAAGTYAAIRSHADDMKRCGITAGSCNLHDLQQPDFSIPFNKMMFKLAEQLENLVPGNERSNGKFLTGYPEIDHELNLVIRLVIRHHVKSWYHAYVSSDNEFPKDVDSLIRSCIRVIACKIRTIDRVSYFTTNLVDDFASHIRLYRLAIEKQAELAIEDPNADLVSLFFDLELQMEGKKVCRDVACSNPRSLYGMFDRFIALLVKLSLHHSF